ncbi:Stk1 family PASTA domain-containing Ser/Thr kinase [Actinacidiphila glaucinigra]|uniref:Stk1 family PASTA domain-containing Ser/Thr kinase n=1 Tax=Actinacidiphila glaucinigra TaxID=235986 RepID=UPI002DD9B436|nr:Stk1 family PASTA domain-containing Ser/Thr kinase [Actinacidiphila glaucinigra]WSD62600.1 Stk1 family PASTA domain-containing Ser/Thr kinase [Actinacidiphila glaucinigra]
MDRTTLRDPLVGQTLDGRYRVESRIAVGGMATVYRALDTRLDRLLALKVMHPALSAEPGFVERFIREAKTVARLDHPNVVQVYDQGTDGTYVYLAMEYIAGCTLRDVLRDRGALPARAALDILEPVLAALGAAHRAGLVHRDMKPENVLIGDDGRVKVADFGLVRIAGTHTDTSTSGVLGTVSYMAPEQVENRTTDERTDVYACGVLLYEMLTGGKPHRGRTPVQVIHQLVNEDVPAPSAASPGLPPQLDALVAEATARAAARRPADAAELLRRLHAVRQGMTPEQLDLVPPAARTPAPAPAAPAGSEEPTTVVHRTARLELSPEPTRRQPRVESRPGLRSRRRPGVIAVVTTLLLILGVGAGIWYINDGQFTRTPAVVGLPQAQAERQLRDAGLRVEVVEAFDPTMTRGKVASTDPGTGERIRDNGTVTVTVSKGPERVTVPGVVGEELAEAKRRLKAAGLSPGTVSREFSDEVPQGRVISTDPGSGASRRPDSAVSLVVSKGVPVDTPDLLGQPLADARRQLQEAGLRVKVDPRRVFSDQADEGAVAGQTPGANTRLAAGDTVTLTVSKGQEMIGVPDVEGLDVDEAKAKLEAAGFDVRVIQFFFTGQVNNQSPAGGTEAPKGSTITLWVR